MRTIKYKTILVTHDGSECASAILPHVTSLCSKINSNVLLLRVIEPLTPDFIFGGAPEIGPYISTISYEATAIKLTKELKEKVKKELEEVREKLIDSGLKSVRTILSEGYPPEKILDFAKRENVDLIMMSTHGRTGLKKALVGSITEQIIHSSSCPVFVIRPTKEARLKGGGG